MSQTYRDTPKWAQNTVLEAETKHLARLEAGAAFLRLLLRAAGAHAEAISQMIKDGRNQPAPQPEPQPEPKKPRKHKEQAVRKFVPRVYAPHMLVLGQRAAEMLVELAPIIRERTIALVRAGIDPRKSALREAANQIAQVFLDELGIDLEQPDQASAEQLSRALDAIKGWISEAKASPVHYIRAAGKEGPVSGPPECAKANLDALVERALAPNAPVPNAPAPNAPAPNALAPDAPAPDALAPNEAAGRAPQPYSAGQDSLRWTRE